VFETHPEIDAIEIVVVEDYIEEIWTIKDEYNLSKIRWVVQGGKNFQESAYNGIMNLKNTCSKSDIIMLAMSVSPLISDEIITDSLKVCKEFGNAIAADHSIYNLSPLIDGHWSDSYILKEEHVTLNLPWTFPYEKLHWAYQKAYSEGSGMDDRSYTTTLMIKLGEKLYFSKDSAANRLKLTTYDDLDMLEGYLLIQELRKGNLNIVDKVRKQKEQEYLES